ncbi:hypothetical protein B0H14DRAFT_2631051 [Mycena olivaceomarginata]|nr:hypothetical protein B0H14DRAFT_2631051 [Mycena olivaceomarginata]
MITRANLSDDLLITTHGTDAWPSQANHIFSRLQTMPHFEDYEFRKLSLISSNAQKQPWWTQLYFIFQIQQLPNTINPHQPKGYLCLCPPTDFRIGPSSFKWPDRPAYWSLDPSDANCLSSEDTKILGFPALHIGTHVHEHGTVVLTLDSVDSTKARVGIQKAKTWRGISATRFMIFRVH